MKLHHTHNRLRSSSLTSCLVVLMCVSLQTRAASQIVGSVDTPGLARALVVSGDFAYIADGGSGLTIVDVSDPTNPQLVISVDTPGSAAGIDLVGTVAYVADFGGGLRLFDVSDPHAPGPLGSTVTAGSAHDVVVSGTTAFVADEDSGLTIIDVSNTASPSVITSFAVTGDALAVEISHAMAFVATGLIDLGVARGGLEIVDVTDTANPSLTGRIDLPTPGFGSAVATVGEAAYIVRAGFNFIPYPTEHFIGLDILDVSSPGHPQLLGTAPLRLPIDVFANRLGTCIVGTQALCACGEGGLNFVDITNPSHPFNVGHVSMTAQDVAIEGDYIYVAARENGLIVVDIAAIPEVPFPATYAARLMLVFSLAFVGFAVSRRLNRAS